MVKTFEKTVHFSDVCKIWVPRKMKCGLVTVLNTCHAVVASPVVLEVT